MSFESWCVLRLDIIRAYLYEREKNLNRRLIAAGAYTGM
jgi:hypothetical protein